MRIGPAAGIIGANTRTPVATMSALTIPNFPPEMLAQFRDHAARSGRTVEEEIIFAVGQVLATKPADADSGPCAFDRPVTGPTFQVAVGGERLPALPIILDPTAE